MQIALCNARGSYLIGYGVATRNLAAGVTFLGGALHAAGNLMEIGEALGRSDCIWQRFAFISVSVITQLGWTMKRAVMSGGIAARNRGNVVCSDFAE